MQVEDEALFAKAPRRQRLRNLLSPAFIVAKLRGKKGEKKWPLRVELPDELKEQARKNPLKTEKGNAPCFNFLSNAGCKSAACRYEHFRPATKDRRKWWSEQPAHVQIEILRRGGPAWNARISFEKAQKAIQGVLAKSGF